MKKLILAIFLMLSAAPVFGLSLDEAKTGGLVGEKPNGYLGAVTSSPEVDALVSDINIKRKEKYSEIAKRNGTPVAAVEALAGEKALEKTPTGQYIQTASGAWKKK